ncbi:MAG: VOC family protein [Clostridia bacterium]|nr:VOC family protein [Clostridia bacterium]
MEIHHIGYLVKNIDKALTSFINLGFKSESKVYYDPIQKSNITFLSNGTYLIELVEPATEDAITFNLQKKIGNSPYHICYKCNDIENTFNELREKGFSPMSEIVNAVAFEGKRICFMFKKDIGIIELVEN